MPVVKFSLNLLGGIHALGELGGPLDGVAPNFVFVCNNLSGISLNQRTILGF